MTAKPTMWVYQTYHNLLLSVGSAMFLWTLNSLRTNLFVTQQNNFRDPNLILSGCSRPHATPRYFNKTTTILRKDFGVSKWLSFFRRTKKNCLGKNHVLVLRGSEIRQMPAVSLFRPGQVRSLVRPLHERE